MAEPRTSPALELVQALASDRAASERRFELAVATARLAGEPVAAIASAADLSTSRTSAILEKYAAKPAAPGPLARAEISWVMENAPSVGIVPAGQIALHDYATYAAYICQPHRSFKSEMTRLGFYSNREISPHFPQILKTWASVPFTEAEAQRQRATGDPELAELITKVLATPNSGGHRPGNHKVMLLTPPNHPDTVTLPHPIRHLTPGRGQAYVRKQRYTTEAALQRQPTTTEELMRYELGS